MKEYHKKNRRKNAFKKRKARYKAIQGFRDKTKIDTEMYQGFESIEEAVAKLKEWAQPDNQKRIAQEFSERFEKEFKPINMSFTPMSEQGRKVASVINKDVIPEHKRIKKL